MTFDSAGDKLFEPLRKNAVSQRVFSMASTIGDFSVVWHVIGVLCAVISVISFRETLSLSVALGCESLIVNQGLKRIFRRDRPTVSGDERFDIRTPSTSSFPSGHASSATCAAIILTSFTAMPLAIVWILVGVVVALSRVVVRIHHLSDILGGLVAGAVLGGIAVPVINAIL
jgi:membrane-associated phospholipid phosphatase